MAQIGNFDASAIDPSQPFDPLPAGWYAMQIVASSVDQSRTSDGQYLKLELEVLESFHPKYKGRKVWDRLNLWNQNQQAVDIAQRSLSAICRATGEINISDSEALHHKPVAVKLRVRPGDGKYDESNDISGYDAVQARFQVQAPQAPSMDPVAVGVPAVAAGTMRSAPATRPVPASMPPATSKPPWQR